MKNLNLFEQTTQNVNFQRRRDLTPDIRLYIAFVAKMNDTWGIITALAKQYCISRTFVYMLRLQLDTAVLGCFGDKYSNNTEYSIPERKMLSIELALSLRLEGKCSITAISSILKRFNLPFGSVGSISGILNAIGKYLPNTIELDENQQAAIYVYLASDEIFSHSRPILISADPISSAILKIQLGESRETKVWIDHFNSLKDNGVNIINVVCDEAKPICSAVEQSLDKIRQPDTFHAVSHRPSENI